MCPPGTDQTTRSGQMWNLLSPASHQRQPLFSTDSDYYSRDSPQTFLGSKLELGAFEKLAKLPGRSLKTANAAANASFSQSIDALSPIERMPAELLGMVLTDPDLEAKDVVALGMCSNQLWAHTISHIQRDVKDLTAPWAGKPLLCSGTWLTSLPPAIYDLYPQEVAAEKVYQDRQGGRSYGRCPARNWNWHAVSHYHDAEGQSVKEKWLEAFRVNRRGAEMPPYVLGKLWNSLRHVVDGAGSTEQKDWILRNSNTKEYVRLQLRRGERDGSGDQAYIAGARWLSLSHALILRICWGEDSGWPRDDAKLASLLRGPWAGHCFDIVEDAGEVGSEWRDATSEIIKEGKIWGCGKAMKGRDDGW